MLKLNSLKMCSEQQQKMTLDRIIKRQTINKHDKSSSIDEEDQDFSKTLVKKNNGLKFNIVP